MIYNENIIDKKNHLDNLDMKLDLLKISIKIILWINKIEFKDNKNIMLRRLTI